MKSTTIRARAAAGRIVTFPQSTIAGAGATNLRLAGEGAEADGAVTGVVEVPVDAFVRKRLRAGDLIEARERREPVPAKEAKE